MGLPRPRISSRAPTRAIAGAIAVGWGIGVLAIAAMPAPAAEPQQAPPAAVAGDALIVTTAPDSEVAGARNLTTDGSTVEVDPGIRSPEAAATELRHEPGVLSVERDVIAPFTADAGIRSVNDPLAAAQWALSATGWYLLPAGFAPTGTIAILDSGIDLGHPDLSGTLPDGRPKVGAVWSTSSDDDDVTDELGHGTATASLAAALTGNGEGIASISPGTQLMVVKVGSRFASAGGDPYYGVALSDAIQGIDWAVDHGATVINISFAFPTNSPALRLAVLRAIDRGVVIVAAVGNDGCAADGGGNELQYPAGYPHVIGVSASTRANGIACFSNHGPEVDIAAPGARVEMAVARGARAGTLRTDSGYTVGSGTSFAAPMVSAAAALVAAQHPRWTPDQIREALTQSARDIGKPGWDDRAGSGLLNLEGAVAVAAAGRDSFEINDDVAFVRDQRPLIRGGVDSRTIEATIHRSDDPVDVYPVALRRGQRLQIALAGRAVGRVAVQVWRPGTPTVSGSRPVSRRYIATSHQSHGTLTTVNAKAQTTGTYYVCIRSSGSSGTYRLSLTRR